MRINEVQLAAFRSYQGVSLNTSERRIFITGGNSVGKSTVREAIRWCLTGKAQNAEGDDQGGEMLAPDFLGVDLASGSVVLDGLGRVERQWTPGTTLLRVTGFTGTPTVQQEALYAHLKTSEAFLQAVLDSRAFLRLHHAKGKALLLGLLDVKIQIGEVIEGVGTYVGLDQLDVEYKRAFEDRKTAKNRLKAVQVPSKPVWQAPYPAPELSEVDAKLTERRKQLEEALTARGTVGGERTSLEKAKAKLSVPTPKESVRYPYGPADVVGKIAEIQKRIDELDQADASDEQFEKENNPHYNEKPGDVVPVSVLRSRIDALRAHKPKEGCVIESGVECPVAKLRFNNRAREIENEIAARPVEKPVAPVAPPPEDPRIGLLKILDSLLAMQAGYKRFDEQESKRQEDLADVSVALAQLPDTSEQDKVVEKLRESVAKGETVRSAVQTHQEALRAHEQGQERLKGAQAEVDRLEALCDVLGPTGARVAALEQALGGFEGKVNEVTGKWGWAVKIQAEPWSVVVNGRPVESYSWSEMYRIGIALQLAIAEVSGLSFAVVDEMDLLDRANRAIVGQMLVESPLSQIFVLGTREPEAELPKMPGAIWVRLALREKRSIVVERSGVGVA